MIVALLSFALVSGRCMCLYRQVILKHLSKRPRSVSEYKYMDTTAQFHLW